MSLLRLYKRFRWWDWIFLLLICGLTFLQVYCTMQNVDYIAGLTAAIQKYFTMKAAGVAYDAASDLWRNGLMMLAMSLGTVLCQVVIAILASEMTASLATRVRKELYDKINSFSLAEINKFSTASLITRTSNDVENVQMSTLMMFRMVFSAPITAVWAILKIQETNGALTWVAVAAITIIVIVLLVVMILVIPKFQIVQKLIDRLNVVTREGISGVRVVRAYNAEGYQDAKFKKANDDLTRLNLFTGRMMQLFWPIMTIVLDGATLGIYAIGAHLLKQDAIAYSTIVSFATLITQIIMAFMMLLMLFIMLPRAMVCAKRIEEVLKVEPSIVDPEAEEALKEAGTLEFRDVSFAYPDADSPVLSGISFSAKKGETIAFIGATGSGKTTLVNLVARLYDATSGSVLVDGVDVRRLKQNTLRSKIGFVPQKGNLFSGTVSENIAFGEGTVDPERVHHAAEVACADEFVSRMPGGYEAPIAAGGTNVSGGQRQRLCIARAAYLNPEFFVFDDSFSALDFKTDKAVRSHLKEAFPEATKLIVAQRVGTIMDADRIVVLEEGKAVGVGTHEWLLRNCPTYRDIALSQLSKEELGL